MARTPKIEHLIVDTSAFIKNVGLQEIGENIMTVQAVVNEITNKRQLKRLVVLPYDLKIKDTFPEHVKFVTEFSKLTGDFQSLSATDIQVIALTYQLEKEHVGTSHLKTAPTHKPIINLSSQPFEDMSKVAGFHVSSNKNLKETKVDNDSNSVSSSYETASENEESDVYEDTEDVEKDKVELILKKVEEEEEYTEKGDEEDSDEDDWITPSNIKQIKNELGSGGTTDERAVVACLTTDFAMQNVLKQIGLNVVTIDGKLIKELRTYILRCYGCFKTTSVMTKVFCPKCGNKTLKRVVVTVDPDGTQRIHINTKRPLTARGKKFTVQRFKGGKHANNPILSEDQPQPKQRLTKLSRTKNNPLDDDYIAGFSPFIMRDVTSKSAMLGLREHENIKHMMRNNPNNKYHKRSGRRKK